VARRRGYGGLRGHTGRVDWWQALLAAAGGLLLLWLVLLVVLWWVRPDGTSTSAALRLLPDLVRLVRRLAADRTLPRGVRVRLWLLLVYLLSPIDLVPDVVPVLGYADDVVVVALALRAVVRRAGSEALARHWPGDPAGLAVVSRLAGLPRPSAGTAAAPG
jgi:uncharacterized membrane protein YkvA (DUF1232 family)